MPGLLDKFRKAAAVLLVVVAFLATPFGAARAETPILSAADAAARIASGDLVLLDIRTAEEWAQSGIAEGAWPVSMHVDDFPDRLQEILEQYQPQQIGLICATGGRSGYVAKVLERNGIAGIADISEGMFGNESGRGWIAQGLPITTVRDALANYDAARTNWTD